MAPNEDYAFHRMTELLGWAEYIEEALRSGPRGWRGTPEDPSGLLESERLARLREDARVLTERLRETLEDLKGRAALGAT
jgi:hypothetical protein